MTQTEQISQLLGVVVAAIIAGVVAVDARRRGLPTSQVLGWGAGVLLLLIVFLPLYLWQRRDSKIAKTSASPAPIAGVPCPYCGYENAGKPDYCGKCGRQLRSSTEIHR